MKRLITLIGLVFLLGMTIAGGSRAEDEVEELIQGGQIAYQKGNLSYATEQLQQALNLIAELSVQISMGLLPAAPVGWVVEQSSAEDSTLFSGIGGLFVATKSYQQVDAGLAGKKPPVKKTMTIALVSNLPAFAQMAVQGLARLRDSASGVGVVVIAGFKGTVNCNKKQRCEVMILLGDKALVTAESQNVPRIELLAMLRKIKLDQF